MTNRLALPLALIVAAGCADKLTGPEAQAAARQYQSRVSLNGGPIAADKTPLIFVDGKEFSADSVRRFPSENIESVEVFKGNAAIKKYGARAQNGVIVVVTKK